MYRLRVLLSVVCLLSAGCTGLAPPSGGSSPTATPTASATDGPTATSTADPTPGTPRYGPEPDHDVVVENRLDGEVTIHVRVIREATNGTVYEGTVTLPPSERIVYNTAEADPDGIESFRIVAERGGDRASVTIETNACYGDAIVSANDDGGVDATYSIC